MVSRPRIDPFKTAIFIVGLIILATSLVCLSLRKNPHAKLDCIECHSPSEKNRARLAGPITLICRRCHEDLFNEGYMHPFDVKPSKKVQIPPDFPLSDNGEITCITCHDVHMTANLGSPFLNQALLRRNETGPFFCEICHGQALGIGKLGHAQALGEAHMRPKYVITNPGVSIDPISKNCISCHDGSYATGTKIMAGVWSHGKDFIGNDMGTHPIGVDYEKARTRPGRKTELRPMATVDPRIKFFDGKVGCGSCHDPYKHSKDDLVIPNYQSRLCFACHAIDQ